MSLGLEPEKSLDTDAQVFKQLNGYDAHKWNGYRKKAAGIPKGEILHKNEVLDKTCYSYVAYFEVPKYSL